MSGARILSERFTGVHQGQSNIARREHGQEQDTTIVAASQTEDHLNLYSTTATTLEDHNKSPTLHLDGARQSITLIDSYHHHQQQTPSQRYQSQLIMTKRPHELWMLILKLVLLIFISHIQMTATTTNAINQTSATSLERSMSPLSSIEHLSEANENLTDRHDNESSSLKQFIMKSSSSAAHHDEDSRRSPSPINIKYLWYSFGADNDEIGTGVQSELPLAYNQHQQQQQYHSHNKQLEELFNQFKLNELIQMIASNFGRLILIDDERFDDDERLVEPKTNSSIINGSQTSNYNGSKLLKRVHRTKRELDSAISGNRAANNTGLEVGEHEIEIFEIAPKQTETETGAASISVSGSQQLADEQSAGKTHMSMKSLTTQPESGPAKAEIIKRHKRTHSKSGRRDAAAHESSRQDGGRQRGNRQQQQQQPATTTPMGLMDHLELDNNPPIGAGGGDELQVTSVSSDSLPSSTESTLEATSTLQTPGSTGFKKRLDEQQQQHMNSLQNAKLQLMDSGGDSLNTSPVEQSAAILQAHDEQQTAAAAAAGLVDNGAGGQSGLDSTEPSSINTNSRANRFVLPSDWRTLAGRPAKIKALSGASSSGRGARGDRVGKHESQVLLSSMHTSPEPPDHQGGSGNGFHVGDRYTFDQTDAASTSRPSTRGDIDAELVSKEQQLNQLVRLLAAEQNNNNNNNIDKPMRSHQLDTSSPQSLARPSSGLQWTRMAAPNSMDLLTTNLNNNNNIYNHLIQQANLNDSTTSAALSSPPADLMPNLLMQAHISRGDRTPNQSSRSKRIYPLSSHESLTSKNRLALEENFYNNPRQYSAKQLVESLSGQHDGSALPVPSLTPPLHHHHPTPQSNEKKPKRHLRAAGSKILTQFASINGNNYDSISSRPDTNYNQQYSYLTNSAGQASPTGLNQVLSYLRGGNPTVSSSLASQQSPANGLFGYQTQATIPSLTYNNLIPINGNQQPITAALMSHRQQANLQPAMLIPPPPKQTMPIYNYASTNRFGMAYQKPQISTKRQMTASGSNNHRSLKQTNSGYDEPSAQASSSMGLSAGNDPLLSDGQHQEEDYQQSPQTIQITAVPNGLVGNGLNGFNGFNGGWNGAWGGGPWNGRQVMLVSRQPGVGSEWRQWALPIAIILALPLILGALFVPVFLKSVMFLIQILQMLGLLMPPHQLAGHLAGSHSSSSSSG